MDIVFILILLIISYIDIKTREIPNALCILIGLISLFNFHPLGILSAVPFFIVACINPQNMGGGDIKLVAVVGLYLGFDSTILGLQIALLASLTFYILSGRKTKYLPLAPFLTIGFILTIVGGI